MQQIVVLIALAATAFSGLIGPHVHPSLPAVLTLLRAK